MTWLGTLDICRADGFFLNNALQQHGRNRADASQDLDERHQGTVHIKLLDVRLLCLTEGLQIDGGDRLRPHGDDITDELCRRSRGLIIFTMEDDHTELSRYGPTGREPIRLPPSRYVFLRQA